MDEAKKKGAGAGNARWGKRSRSPKNRPRPPNPEQPYFSFKSVAPIICSAEQSFGLWTNMFIILFENNYFYAVKLQSANWSCYNNYDTIEKELDKA